jgi:hypothetical protein
MSGGDASGQHQLLGGSTMNTKIAILAGAAALVTAGVGLGLDGPASAHAVTHTMTFTTRQITDKIINDVDVATDKNLKHGTVIGYDVTSCRVNVQTHLARCDIALARTGGLLYAHGSVNVVTGHGSGTVTGGTRKFAGATGTWTSSMPTITIHWSN